MTEGKTSEDLIAHGEADKWHSHTDAGLSSLLSSRLWLSKMAAFRLRLRFCDNSYTLYTFKRNVNTFVALNNICIMILGIAEGFHLHIIKMLMNGNLRSNARVHTYTHVTYGHKHERTHTHTSMYTFMQWTIILKDKWWQHL